MYASHPSGNPVRGRREIWAERIQGVNGAGKAYTRVEVDQQIPREKESLYEGQQSGLQSE